MTGKSDKSFKKKNFVEEGEYQRNFYGTSIDSVREVVDSGKYAILVLNAPSINVMRKEGLKPYVIFIKPPRNENLIPLLRVVQPFKFLKSMSEKFGSNIDFENKITWV